jgi:hypothetical protein
MILARPLFLAVLVAGLAMPVFAADEGQSQKSSNASQSAATGTAQTVTDASGLIFSVAEPRTLNRPPVASPPIAKLDDGTCYTIRMYKIKRTEHIAKGESAGRGYATCEMASSYQYRSAVAQAPVLEDSTAEPRK